MTIFQAVILGLVEGFTEFLPVSSTAHILLVQKVLGVVLNDTVATFTIAVQAGSILAALFLYARYFLSLRRVSELFVVLIPTILAGVLIHPHIKVIFANVLFIIPWTLFFGGLCMLWAEKKYKKNKIVEERELTFKEKVVLGFAQTLALIPGVSRSAAMVVTGLFSHFPRQALTSFTFVLAVPTMFSATLYDIHKTSIPLSDIVTRPFIIGLTISFLTALLSIQFMLYLVRTYTFIPFAWYRIFLGVGIGLLVYM